MTGTEHTDPEASTRPRGEARELFGRTPGRRRMMARLVERLNQWGVEKNGGSSGLSDSEKQNTRTGAGCLARLLVCVHVIETPFLPLWAATWANRVLLLAAVVRYCWRAREHLLDAAWSIEPYIGTLSNTSFCLLPLHFPRYSRSVQAETPTKRRRHVLSSPTCAGPNRPFLYPVITVPSWSPFEASYSSVMVGTVEG